jgi:MYXO-CTERM domain-containing protein
LRSVTVTVSPGGGGGGGGGGEEPPADDSGGGTIDWLLGSMLLGLVLHTRRRRVRLA